MVRTMFYNWTPYIPHCPLGKDKPRAPALHEVSVLEHTEGGRKDQSIQTNDGKLVMGKKGRRVKK